MSNKCKRHHAPRKKHFKELSSSMNMLFISHTLTHSLNPLLTQSFTQSVTHLVPYSLSQSLTHSVSPLLTQSVPYSLSQSLTHSITHSVPYSRNHLLSPFLTQSSLTHSITHSVPYSLNHLLSPLLTQSLIHSLTLFFSLMSSKVMVIECSLYNKKCFYVKYV